MQGGNNHLVEGTPVAVHSHRARAGTLHRGAVIVIPQNLQIGTANVGTKQRKHGKELGIVDQEGSQALRVSIAILHHCCGPALRHREWN